MWNVEIPSNSEIKPIIPLGCALSLVTEKIEIVTNMQAIIDKLPTIANIAFRLSFTEYLVSRNFEQEPMNSSSEVLFR